MNDAKEGQYSEYASSLSEAFTAFTEGAERMKEMYQKLEERIEYLNQELERKNLELEKAQRLASLVELAAGVAHEIRNPLGGIELCATMLSRDVGKDGGSRDLVNNIIEGVRRLNSIVTSLLTFTKEERLQLRECGLAGVLEEALESASEQTRAAGVAVIKKIQPSLTVSCDPDRLRQVFINMVANAAEAMPEGGVLTVTLQKEGAWAVAAFEDTGVGMSRQQMDKIFNPFFTTKENGTGLGLAISYKIVNDHGGRITVQSEQGKGSKFEIFLPCALSGTENN